MPYRACGPFLLALLMAACGEASRPSAQENSQLNEAEQMLDEADKTLANIDDTIAADAPAQDPAAQD